VDDESKGSKEGGKRFPPTSCDRAIWKKEHMIFFARKRGIFFLALAREEKEAASVLQGVVKKRKGQPFSLAYVEKKKKRSFL